MSKIELDNRYPRIDKFIGSNLRDLRIKKGLSHTALAKATNLSEEDIYKYESGLGRIPASIILILASHMGFEPVYLFKDRSELKKTSANSNESNTVLKFFALPEAEGLMELFIQIESYEKRLDILEYLRNLIDLKDRNKN